jgi:3'-5' exoribonuclease
MPTTEKDVEGMYAELLGYVNQIGNKYLHALAEQFYIKDTAFVKKFKEHSAAKSVHHSFAGGLLEHTLSIVKFCEYLADTYALLNRDLLYSAALFHDIGKTKELSDFPENDYTDAGQLLGHIVIGVEMIGEAVRNIEGFPETIANELKHCVIAHHGELEFGSPKKPAIPEAVALHYADATDAKLQTLTEIFKDKEGTEWLGFNRLFDSNIRKSSL